MIDEFAPKLITFGDDARAKLLAGSKVIHDAVGSTMGPAGQFALYQDFGYHYSVATKDGVSVAQKIILEDAEENEAAFLIRQAAEKQVDETGDGTTLAVILSYVIFKAAVKMIAAGHSATTIKREITEAVKIVVEDIKGQAIPADIKQIATVSANGDTAIGELISGAIERVGQYGVVVKARSKTENHHVEFSKGYEWDSGINNEIFVNSPEGMTLENPHVLVTDEMITSYYELVPIIEQIAKEAATTYGVPIDKVQQKMMRPLVVICPDVTGDALAAISNNVKDGNYFSAWISPAGGRGTTERKYAFMDIAALTGAEFISGVRLREVKLSQLGSCESIISNPRKTIIKNDSEKIKERVEFLKNHIQSIDEKDPQEIDFAEKSIARLLGGLATIYIGGKIWTEYKEVFDRFDDAIKACKSAKELGMVRGGGVAMIKARNGLRRPYTPGKKIILEALQYPTEKILSNAKRDDTALIISKLVNTNSKGYDINTGKSVDMFDIGVVDPAKVIIHALKNAASVACTLLQVNVLITDKPKKG